MSLVKPYSVRPSVLAEELAEVAVADLGRHGGLRRLRRGAAPSVVGAAATVVVGVGGSGGDRCGGGAVVVVRSAAAGERSTATAARASGSLRWVSWEGSWRVS